MRISDWSSDVCSSDLRRGGSTVALCGPWASTCQRNPAKTGACEVDWIAGTVTQLDRPTSDEQRVEAVLSVDMAAIDVPLGWPDAFIDAVVAHRDRRRCAPIAAEPPRARLPVPYRTPHLLTRRSGSQPLSLSMDRVGGAAMRRAQCGKA